LTFCYDLACFGLNKPPGPAGKTHGNKREANRGIDKKRQKGYISLPLGRNGQSNNQEKENVGM
jgi:hypothetical protein